jgi:hypothetical protein
MRKAAARENCLEYLGKAAGALLLMAGLALLAGCQGLSAAGTSNQQQIGTLSASANLGFGSVPATAARPYRSAYRTPGRHQSLSAPLPSPPNIFL